MCDDPENSSLGPCEFYIELINAQLDDELSPAEEQILTEHLASCPSCRAMQRDLRKIHEMLQQLPLLDLPDEMKSIAFPPMPEDGESDSPVPSIQPAPHRRRFFTKKWLAAAACFAVVVGSAMVFLKNRPFLPNFQNATSADHTTGLPENRARIYVGAAAGDGSETSEDSGESGENAEEILSAGGGASPENTTPDLNADFSVSKGKSSPVEAGEEPSSAGTGGAAPEASENVENTGTNGTSARTAYTEDATGYTLMSGSPEAAPVDADAAAPVSQKSADTSGQTVSAVQSVQGEPSDSSDSSEPAAARNENENEASLTPRAALEQVAAATNQGSMQSTVLETNGTLACTNQLFSGGTLVEEAVITYDGLSENSRYYLFTCRQDDSISHYAVALENGDLLQEDDAARSETFWETVNE